MYTDLCLRQLLFNYYVRKWLYCAASFKNVQVMERNDWQRIRPFVVRNAALCFLQNMFSKRAIRHGHEEIPHKPITKPKVYEITHCTHDTSTFVQDSPMLVD